MKTHVTQWGNSLGVRIPKAFADQIGLEKEGDVEMELEKDAIVLRKPGYNLEDLLKQIKPENLHEETDTGALIGKEQW